MSGLTIPQIKAMLQDRAQDLAEKLAPAGRRKGACWRGPSPLRAGSDSDTFAIWLSGAAKGAFIDFVSGEKGDVIDLIAAVACGAQDPKSKDGRHAALEWAQEFLNVRAGSAEVKQRAALASRNAEARAAAEIAEREVKRKRAFDLWGRGVSPFASVVEKYLWTRGIDIALLPGIGSSIRYCPRVEHPFEPHVGPAMLAAFRREDGGFAACHVTFLAIDGGKADVEKRKLFFGGISGASIWISAGAPGGPRAVTEGIENAMTVALARPSWRLRAAGAVGNLGEQRGVDFVCADNDVNPTPVKALERAIEKLRARGEPAVIARALGAKDFNEMLTA